MLLWLSLVHSICPELTGLHAPLANVWPSRLSYVVSVDHPSCAVCTSNTGACCWQKMATGGLCVILSQSTVAMVAVTLSKRRVMLATFRYFAWVLAYWFNTGGYLPPQWPWQVKKTTTPTTLQYPSTVTTLVLCLFLLWFLTTALSWLFPFAVASRSLLSSR